MATTRRFVRSKGDQARGQVSKIRFVGYKQFEIVGLIQQVFVKCLR